MIPEDKWFYFANGGKASSIEELKQQLEVMSDSEFSNHVNNHKNDFANWIGGVFNENDLARDLREVSDKDGLLILLEDFIEQKNKPAMLLDNQTSDNQATEMPDRFIIPEHKMMEMPKAKSDYTNTTNTSEYSADSSVVGKSVADNEKELSEKDIRGLVSNAKSVFQEEDAQKPDKYRAAKYGAAERYDAERYDAMVMKEQAAMKEHSHRFVVKEFIYGFVLGLIFGLIMLGVLLNLKAIGA